MGEVKSTKKADGVPEDDAEVESCEPEQRDQYNYDLSDTDNIIAMFQEGQSDDQINVHVTKHVSALVEKANLPNYCVLLLFDDWNSISTIHSNRIYRAISGLQKKKDLLLILQSGGGKIEPAYLISKTCKRLAKERFNVCIPRRAKSAATLIALGAAELHMGFLSELGPIDPQFSGFPASGLSNALEKITELSIKFPGSSDLLAKYLTDNLDIQHLGYFDRVNESAAQYAERLLSGKKLPKIWTEETLADHLTNHYKDHGFVIDSDEATSLLGNSIVKENTPEYELSNTIYEFLDFLDSAYLVFREKNTKYVGDLSSGFTVTEKLGKPANTPRRSEP